MFIIMYFSFKFNFGNGSTVSAPDKGLCCKLTNIGKNDIMYILNQDNHIFEYPWNLVWWQNTTRVSLKNSASKTVIYNHIVVSILVSNKYRV